MSFHEPVIGLEVHCQLRTNSKAFSPESARFGAEPNTNVDPISLGHPGTLPVLNDQVVEFTLRMGLATHCTISPRSVFARKHYFYPDLPKGYQISQYETPICHGGYIEIEAQEGGGGEASPAAVKRIGITRIHVEEDAGKSLHDQDAFDTLVDYNRCGVPLIEIVSEPDLRSPREAFFYVQKIRQIVRYLGVCDGNMEEGSLRCDANVSVRPVGQQAFGTKTEIKNMNSFRHVERALEYEISRQIRLLDAGQAVVQETRLWDAARMETRSMRSKEEAHDYRYFPDPDLVQVVVDESILTRVKSELPEMPEARRQRFITDLGLPAYDAAILTEDRAIADYFERTLNGLRTLEAETDARIHAKAVSNIVMTDVLRVLNERSIPVDEFTLHADRLAELIRMRLADEVSSTGAQEVFNAILDSDARPQDVARERNLIQVSDEGALLPIVERVLDENSTQVDTFLDGKDSVLGFFIGQVMRAFEGSPDPKLVRRLLADRLEARRK